MPEFIAPVLEWVNANPGWAGLVLFLIACGESLALVGLFVPGAVLMFGAGALIATGRLEFWPMMAWASAGAIVGDGASFLLGRYFGDSLKTLWPFRTHPGLIERGVAFFESHGGKSVMLGRFVGPIRPVIPAVAGMLGMPAFRFLLINVVSALLWAPAYLLPGMAFGASLTLAAEVLTRLSILALIIVVVGWVAYRVTHRSLRRILFSLFLGAAVVLVIVLAATTAIDRARWHTAEVLTPTQWREQGWEWVPTRRRGLFGGEPFELQIAATADELVGALRASGWRRADPLDPTAILSWFSPEARPLRLAVLPHWHLGRLPEIVATRSAGERERWVLRAWPTGLRLAPDRRSVWLVTVERERLTPGLLWASAEGQRETGGEIGTLTEQLARELTGRILPKPERQ